MNRVEVTVRIDDRGMPIPVSMIYQGSFYRVDEIGREWSDDEGRHLLAHTSPGDQVFELIHSADGNWLVARGHDRPTVKLA